MTFYLGLYFYFFYFYWRQVDTILSRELTRLGYDYTRRNCMTLCEQKLIIEELGCYDLRLPQILNATPCYTKELFRAISKIKFNFTKCFDYCPFECSSITYEISTSYGDFPSWNYFWDITLEDYEFWKDEIGNLTFDLFKTSVASIFVYFDELKYTDISDSPTMLLPDLIANIGGTLGLFVGVSVLSFAELIELCVNFMIIYTRKVREKRLEKNEINC